jgi:putative SOS response-associated peptidase YedK
MCGRFTLKTPVAQWLSSLFPELAGAATEIAGVLHAVSPSAVQPRFNIAPTQDIVVVTQFEADPSASFQTMRWGLVPHWADSLSAGYNMINARCETLTQKVTFKSALAANRCVVIADGYYEWQKPPASAASKSTKQPYWIHRPAERPFAMAGLWAENRKAVADRVVRSATIITTESNADTQSVHDRMPVILDSQYAIQRWLDRELTHPDEITAMLRPSPPGTFELRPVSTRVNVPRHDGAELIAEQGTLG